MRVFYTIIMVLLLGMLGASSYILWQQYKDFGGIPFITQGKPDFGSFSTNLSFPEGNNSQFYPNMRYKDKRISYWIEPMCDYEKEQEMIGAFSILSEEAVLSFYPAVKDDAEISVFCSELAPEPEEEGHFIAGEGGPSRIINTSVYSVILTGKISLYREDKCDMPQIALHELLHALGFDHRHDKNSIMYPITSCDLQLDRSIIDEINALYSVPSKPDMIIERVSANRTGRYLNFEISVVNYGLEDASDVMLKVYSGGQEVKSFELKNMSIGLSKVLSVQNLKLSGDSDELLFSVSAKEDELSTGNNRAYLVLQKE